MVEVSDAQRFIGELDGIVSFFKVGWPLYMSPGGHALPEELVKTGKKVFLDLKFGDIAETVKRLVRVAADRGVDILTINTTAQAARAAVEARGASKLKVLMVTFLTSLNETDLKELGIDKTPAEYVLLRAKLAKEAGCDGVIASGHEVAAIRKQAGPGFQIVTPGIRPKGAGKDDHKRAATPAESISAGADYLVIGRPITGAPDARKAAQAILEEMQDAFDTRQRVGTP